MLRLIHARSREKGRLLYTHTKKYLETHEDVGETMGEIDNSREENIVDRNTKLKMKENDVDATEYTGVIERQQQQL